jgi:hypothetical protein
MLRHPRAEVTRDLRGGLISIEILSRHFSPNAAQLS